MGYRTLVMFNNDTIHHIKDTPNFGEKLYHLIAQGTKPYNKEGIGHICWVVEQDHADTQKLAHIDSFQVNTLACRGWYPNVEAEELQLRLLKDAADKFGYRLVRKRANEL